MASYLHFRVEAVRPVSARCISWRDHNILHHPFDARSILLKKASVRSSRWGSPTPAPSNSCASRFASSTAWRARYGSSICIFGAVLRPAISGRRSPHSPTPVSTIILRSLPWTIGLMTVSTLMTFILGNMIGALAGYYRKSMALKGVSLVFIAMQPIPYYILAFMLDHCLRLSLANPADQRRL